jgi:prevent-host-death family protein
MYIIMYMRMLAMGDVRSRLAELLDEIEATHERIVITRRGRPSVVLLAVEDLDSMEETLDIMNDPGLVAAIQEGEADAAAGNTYTVDEVIEGLRAQARPA